jgi:hypothetical protein
MRAARLGALALLAACGVPGAVWEPDAAWHSPPDAGGRADSGTRDAGSNADAGERDSGGELDAGVADAGIADGGVADGGVDAGGCRVDACPAPNGGLDWSCERRFAYGNNWAWWNFGADFGGITQWNLLGVAASQATIGADMAQMKDAGSSVVRWWMFPAFRSESILFGPDDAPVGIGGTLVDDIHAALALADQHDLNLHLTLFSFDNFNPSQTQSGIYNRSLQPIVIDPVKTLELVNNLVAPVADAVESSPFRRRMIAWDIINEPEWAMTGPDLYGGPAFPYDPLTSKLLPVNHTQMEAFLNSVADALHAHSSALVTVGSAAIKWAPAWTHTRIDFYTLHYYGWVYQWYPYTTVTLQSVGLTDKPVLIGEFPITGFTNVFGRPNLTALQYDEAMWRYGYAGTLAWSFNDPGFPWNPAAISGFSTEHSCETAY